MRDSCVWLEKGVTKVAKFPILIIGTEDGTVTDERALYNIQCSSSVIPVGNSFLHAMDCLVKSFYVFKMNFLSEDFKDFINFFFALITKKDENVNEHVLQLLKNIKATDALTCENEKN